MAYQVEYVDAHGEARQYPTDDAKGALDMAEKLASLYVTELLIVRINGFLEAEDGSDNLMVSPR
jgi:hypothetical protein